jgi:tetratricopeptide (TPR) repeat protein
MKYIVIYLLLLSLLIFVTGCPSGPPVADNFISSPLNGKIFDHDNLPCSDVIITVDKFTKVKTDINGRFFIPNLTRGKHVFVCEKESYEELAFTYNFLNQNEVLWLKMTSLEQLIRQIDEMFFDKKWDETESLFERASKINPDDPILLYLTSVLYLHKGQIDNARDILLSIIDKGYTEPIIYLSLADIYQYKLDDPANALLYLEKYSALIQDEEVYRRIEELRARLPESSSE